MTLLPSRRQSKAKESPLHINDVDSPEVIERVRRTMKDLKTLMLDCLDEPVQWQDEFGRTTAYFGNFLAEGRIQKETFERLCKEKLKGLEELIDPGVTRNTLK